MKDKMDQPQHDELATSASASHKSLGVDSTRRRLFGAGVAVPVILSMSSRTAWGGALCGPSAFNSMNFSSHAPQAYIADCIAPSGRNVAYWSSIAITTPAEWNYGAPGDASPFVSGISGITMLAVLTNSPSSVEAHGIAALLNANATLAVNRNLFGQSSSASAQSLVLAVFPAFIDGIAVTLPGTNTWVEWNSASYPMKNYFTNYL